MTANTVYLSPNEIPSVLASLTISSSGDTYFSFPALSESGIAVTLLSRNTTNLPKSFAFMSSAALAPNLEDITRSYASGLPPLWVWPGIAILISCVVYALSLSASSYATDGYGLFAITSFLFFLGSSAASFGSAPSATATIVNPLLSLVLLSIALYTFSISYGISGSRITSAPPAIPA